MTETDDTPSLTGKRWKARLVVSLIMLALAFASLVIMKIHPLGYWVFTCMMAGADALLCVWLMWYVRRKEANPFVGNLWHMILHWIGLLAIMYLISVFIDRGVINQTEAGLIALLVVALTLYIAGIYTDTTFMLIGVTLGLMAAGTVLIKAYLWLVMVPVTILVALIIVVMVTRDRQ